MCNTLFLSIVPTALLALAAPGAMAQCPDTDPALTPTIRALLMLEKPAALTEEQWTKVIVNPANRLDMDIVIYEEDRFDPCELPKSWHYVLYAGRRPKEKEFVSAAGTHTLYQID